MAPFRVQVFVDGFNVYHSLVKENKYRKYLWLNYNALANNFLRSDQQLKGVFYFTAVAHWLKDASRRHKIYMRALEAEGVQKVLGRFKKKDRYCPLCRQFSKGHEEKQTDVNLALGLVRGAYLDEYDTAFLVTNDTDLVPAIKMVKQDRPRIKIGVIFPPGRGSGELKAIADFVKYIKPQHLKRSQLPDPYILANGAVLHKPDHWS